MACVINASVSSGLVQTADLSGVLQFQQNGVALPNGGVAPAFSAYGTAFQSVASATFTKIAFNTKDFDTNNNYDSTTNYRFTPTVAGYYQVNATISAGTSATGAVQIAIYKNGSIYSYGSNIPNANLGPNATVSNVVFCNGSTDYLEIFGYQTSGVSINLGSGSSTYKFSACLVRGA